MPQNYLEKEAKMNSLHVEHQWEIMRSKQAEMLKAAQREHLAKQMKQPKSSWLSNLFRFFRPAQRPTIALQPSATPELG